MEEIEVLESTSVEMDTQDVQLQCDIIRRERDELDDISIATSCFSVDSRVQDYTHYERTFRQSKDTAVDKSKALQYLESFTFVFLPFMRGTALVYLFFCVIVGFNAIMMTYSLCVPPETRDFFVLMFIIVYVVVNLVGLSAVFGGTGGIICYFSTYGKPRTTPPSDLDRMKARYESEKRCMYDTNEYREATTQTPVLSSTLYPILRRSVMTVFYLVICVVLTWALDKYVVDGHRSCLWDAFCKIMRSIVFVLTFTRYETDADACFHTFY